MIFDIADGPKTCRTCEHCYVEHTGVHWSAPFEAWQYSGACSLVEGTETYPHASSHVRLDTPRNCAKYVPTQMPRQYFPKKTESMRKKGGLWWTDIRRMERETAEEVARLRPAQTNLEGFL